MKFEIATAGRILFGSGISNQLPELARSLGDVALFVTGRSGRFSGSMCARLADVGIRSVIFHVDGEPCVHLVDQAKDLAMAEGCTLVIAVGGGSVIDAGKAVACMLNNSGDVIDYLEVVGGGRPIGRPAAPWIAVPTTAGTGAEVTRNAVLDVPERGVKVSLRSHLLLPKIALIDPDLTLTLPPAITAFTGMDALTQLIEPFVSNAANPLTDGVCREGLSLASRSLRIAFSNGSDVGARTDLSAAALFGGIALTNARLGAVHGFAGVLGGATGHPHGAICARLLPFVIEANLRALRRYPVPGILDRYSEIARRLTGNPAAEPEDCTTWVRALIDDLTIPPLRASGLSRADFDHVITSSQQASSMKGNPVKLTVRELESILDAAL